MNKLIRMVRESDGKTADVHPDMVDDYRAGGFEPVDADGDGHDDASGEFVEGNKAAAKRKGKK